MASETAMVEAVTAPGVSASAYELACTSAVTEELPVVVSVSMPMRASTESWENDLALSPPAATTETDRQVLAAAFDRL